MHLDIETLANICVFTGLITIPLQILRLYRKKTVGEMVLVNWIIGAANNCVWIFFFLKFEKPDLVRLYKVNFLLCLMVISQIIYYRHIYPKLQR